MVPRLIVGPPVFPGRNWAPIPLRSVCPFCAATCARFYSPMRDLIGRLIFWLALLVLVAIAVPWIARVEHHEHARGQPGRSSSTLNSSPSAVPTKH
jgi:hypothetical protein